MSLLNRRLWILFVGFAVVFLVVALRLAKLQLADAGMWRGKVQQFVHRQTVLDTYRGPIVDRHGAVLAQDVPADELAIDYRAMNQDDSWLKKQAIVRLRAAGEWGHFADRDARDRRLDEVKEAIAGQIEAMPRKMAAILAPYDQLTIDAETEQLLAREENIRARVHAVRQDVFLHRVERDAGTGADDVTASSAGENGMDDASLDELFRQIQLKDEVVSYTLAADIPQPVAIYFKQHIDEFPGLSVRDNAANNRREYPQGEALAHVVGTMRSLDADALHRHPFDMPNLLVENDPGDLSGYLPGDRMGEMGVERLCEEQLRGVRGVTLTDLSSADAAEVRRVDPRPGAAVQLTIDAGLQRDIYADLTNPSKDLLKGEDGKEHFVAVVVMAMDGEILAELSLPSYDPNQINTMRAVWGHDEAHKPLKNRVTDLIYHPGSTVKPLLAAAALTEHVITPTEVINCTGHYYPTRDDIFKCDAVHGPETMVKAIQDSCDVYFYTVGERMGLERLVTWYGRYGMGRETGLELPEQKGNLPAPADIEPEQLKNDAMFMGIGQGPMDVTPLQMANAYATLLRGGVAVAPRVLADTPARQERVFTLDPAILATVREGMEHVVSDGTAKTHFRGFHLRVAGKTGTAETDRQLYDEAGKPMLDTTRPRMANNGMPLLNPDGTPKYAPLMGRGDDAWFVGYAPADKPMFIVAALMEWGGHGGDHAAPMVRDAFTQLERHGYLPRTDVP